MIMPVLVFHFQYMYGMSFLIARVEAIALCDEEL
jgi:hypothetical protein